MSSDMYVSASRRQAESTKRMIQQHLSGYTEMERAIGQFVFNSQLLTGAAYDSAKSHYSSVLLPLVKGGKLYSEAVARAVQRFPDEYVATVDSGDLKESELEQKIAQLTTQIRVKREQQAYLRSLSLHLPSDERDRYNGSQRSLANSLDTLERTKSKVTEKLQKLREFNISSVTLFAELDGLKHNISLGSQLATSSFNGSTFVKPNASQLTWANEINHKWEQRQPEITMDKEVVNVAGYDCEVSKIYVDGVYNKELSDNLNKLIVEARNQEILDSAITLFHTAGEFVLYNDLYRLIYGKDWLSGDESSRLEALGWLALTVLPVSKIARISKEIKAGNNLLKGISLTENELKILNNTKVINNYVATKVTLENGDVAYKALNGELVRSPKYLNDKGLINWPDANGFVVDNLGNPITQEANLAKGQIIDRYGNPTGTFTSPFENGKKIDYDKRGIPYPESSKPYHKYEIVREINMKNVNSGYKKLSLSDQITLTEQMEKYKFSLKDISTPISGDIEKVFGQGGGTQIQLGTSVDWYEKLGLIKEIK